MNKFNVKFYRKVHDDWIIIREFYELRFADLTECENFCVEFLRKKKKLKQITDKLKYSVEEI